MKLYIYFIENNFLTVNKNFMSRENVQGSRRKLNTKKTIAHDDVTHGVMAHKILKKIIDLATRIELPL